MKASVLIQNLQDIVAREGDLEVQTEVCSGLECEFEWDNNVIVKAEDETDDKWNYDKGRLDKIVKGRVIRIT